MANWKGTAVPNTGVYQTIYINTALSTEEVVNILEELNFISLSNFVAYPVMSVDYSSTGGNEGVNYSDLTVIRTEGQLLIMAEYNPIFDSTVGWYDGIETSLINTREGITFMNSIDSDEGLIPVGDQNEKLSSLFSITPFTQDEPITNLPEFLTGIADAIREVKGTNEKINAQNYKPEILKFKELIESGGGGTIVEATITENGTYNSFPTFNTIEINGTTEFDLIVPADAMGFPLSIKKIGALASISELQKGSFTLQTKPDGGVWEPMGNFNMSDISYDAELCGYYFQDIGFSFFYLVDSAPINTILQTSYFENNGVYMSDFFVQYMIASGFTFSGEWMQTYKMYSGEADGANPVIVNIQPKIIDTLTVTKNGTYTVPENNDGYKSVDVQIPLEEGLYITENGIYNPNEGYEGVKKVTVSTPTPKGYITGNRYFDNDVDVLGDDYVDSISSDVWGGIVTSYYQFAGATFRGNVDFSNLNRTETKKFNAILLREGTFAGATFDNDTKIIFPTTGLTRLLIDDRCFLNCKYLYELDTGEISDYISLGKKAFCDCEYLQTVILNAPELYYDVVTHPYYLYETFKGCTNLKEVVFKNYAGVVFPPMNSFPDNEDLLIYFPDDIVESFKTSSDWTDLADKIRPLSEYGNKPTPYLTFSSPNSFTLGVVDNIKYWNGKLEYSTDANTWSDWSGTSAISSSADGKLYMRGTNNVKITGSTSTQSKAVWVLTGSDISCSGNIENLLDYQTVAQGQHPVMSAYCYAHMFYNCTALISAPELPATTLSVGCYFDMFAKCTSLTTAPELPATIVLEESYSQMFANCTSLTTAPELPATTLDTQCYEKMFYYCSSLTTAPEELPATTLFSNSYASMFQGCSSLTTAPEIYATTLDSRCCASMFYGCTNLTTAPNLPATTLAEYCYEAMFYNCTKLTTAPELPATTLTKRCYYQMFYKCASLTTAPELPATTLAGHCYYQMFVYCTNLTSIPNLPATMLAEYCYYQMFAGCSSVKLSTTKTGDYQTAYRVPTSETGTTASNALTAMFVSSGGTFTSTPSINTTYYTSNTVV